MKALTGFSLIELVIVIMLVGILGSAASIMIEKAGTASFLQSVKTDQTWQLRTAIERMSKDISQIATMGVLADGASSLTFMKTSGSEITYEFDDVTPTTVVRKMIETAGATEVEHPLANNISELTFHYYNVNGDEITAGSTPELVRYILMRLTSQSNGVETSAETLIAPYWLGN